MALADLDELLVRATFSSVPLQASISGVSLEVAQPGPLVGPQALEVEQCRCPPGYEGLSCQVSVVAQMVLRPLGPCMDLSYSYLSSYQLPFKAPDSFLQLETLAQELPQRTNMHNCIARCSSGGS